MVPIKFRTTTIGDYWTNNDNRWNIELGKHRHKHFFFNTAAIGMNLDEGYPTFENEHGNERLEGILAFIMKTARLGVPLREMVQADFVCRRGLLRNLAINRFNHTIITFYAVRHRGVIFLCEDKNFGEIPDKLRRAMYFNLKYENVMTLPQVRSLTASKKEETKTVIHASLEKEGAEPIRIYYAAEIDCLDSDGTPIELKSISKPLEAGWDKSRSLAWYMQCFLGKVPKIVVGQRQRNRLRAFRIVEAEQVRIHNPHTWTLEGCLEQLHSALSFVKNYMPIDGYAYKFTAVHGAVHVSTTEFGSYIVPENFLRIFPF
ncbi:unnamed protein product [Caenorhabditis sp. 36 PRJEB53466]|nr:unnamed protein product [Caenorhabditis sp. 36 PRJEB53466]